MCSTRPISPVSLGVCVCALFLAACGTTAVPTSQTRAVSSDAVVAARSVYWVEGGVPITVKRDRGYKGGGGSITFLLNGQPIAKLNTGERVDLRLRPGEYLFGAVSTFNPFNSSPAERTANIRAGGITTYRIHFPPGDATVQIDGTSY